MLLSEYPNRRLPGDLSEAVARLEALAAAVSGDVTLALGVRRWWSWRLQRAADYVALQLVSDLSRRGPVGRSEYRYTPLK